MDQPWVDDELEYDSKLFVEYMKSKGREIEEVEIEDDELDGHESAYDLDAKLEEALGMPLLKRQ